MNEEAKCRLDDGHADSDAIVGEEDVGRIWAFTEEPKESMRDNLIVHKKHDQEMSQESKIHVHVLSDMRMD